MKSGISLLLAFTLMGLIGCSSEDSFLSLETDTEVESDDENQQIDSTNYFHNKWTYSQMKHHYLWNKEIPDSSKLDFNISPSKFFYALLSEKDRFSWCEINYNYSSTKGYNPGSTVSFDSVYTYKNLKIGYGIYDEFGDNSAIRSFVIRMKKSDIDELILDLRYNPGGYVSTCNELASFFVPHEHLGKLFQQQQYNETLTRENALKNKNKGIDSVYLESNNWYKTWGLNLRRLIVLTTKNTASASEALIYGLMPYMDVIAIGTQTCGKDVGSYTIVNDNYKYQLQPITFRYYNALHQSVPTEGIVPDIIVTDDRKVKRGEIEEALLNAALKYIIENPLTE